MYKVVIIGEKEDILPYQSLGVEIEPVRTIGETVNVLRKTALDVSVEIILITENMAEHCLDTISEVRNKTSKAITVIPTHQGSRAVSIKELEKEAGRAVGVNIIVKE